ncbi:DUF5929 domain-containing protein, partial [Aurantibacter sp.]|uniref:DUF5929 domain-containing protein n=1 Tax=Aurantibacter sp. TaxID=2807103 RepID=UPI003264D1CF
EGSISMPKVFDVQLKDINSNAVATIEKHAKNNIELTLDGVIDFINNRHKDLDSNYKVFKEQFIVCWAGKTKVVKNQTYFSRVDIELINEQVKLFYSALDEVTISYNDDSFTTVEYVQLELGESQKYFPLEETNITFAENGTYQIQSALLFEPPQYDAKTLHHIFNANNALLQKLKKKIKLNPAENRDIKQLPDSYVICYFNGFEDAKDKLEIARPLLKKYDQEIYLSLKEALRILRKVKYN